MIRPLRVAHRRIIPALGLLLPLATAAALQARRPPPTMDTLPQALAPVRLDAGAGPRRDGLWTGAFLATTLGRAQGRRAVSLSPLAPLRQPDPLLYWVEEAPAPGGALPAACWLLGTLGEGPDQVFLLPASAGSTGALVLYSLPNAAVIASAPLTEGGP